MPALSVRTRARPWNAPVPWFPEIAREVRLFRGGVTLATKEIAVTRNQPHVVIVGGGIGGLAAAIALRREGVAVTVLERAAAYTDVGSALELGPNATRILRGLDLLERLRPVAVRPEASQFLRWQDGTILQETPLGAEAEAYFGGPLLCFHRPDLLGVLAEALPAECLRLGAPVVGLDQDEDGVEVRLESGDRVRADVVIAADGIRSAIRRDLVGSDDPVYSGTIVYRGNVPSERLQGLGLTNVKRYWMGPGRHVVSYWLSAGRTMGVALAVQRPESAAESWSQTADPGEALGYVAGWDPRAYQMLERSDALLRTAVYTRRPLERWAYGRVALLGDSAHAMVPFQGQGAATAIEDAAVLAGCLSGCAREDIVAALRRYEALSMARADDQQRSSQSSGDFMNLPDGEAQRRRDAALAKVDPDQRFGARQPVWEYDVRAVLSGPA
jgi:salicylate hydroxylase